MQKTVYDIIMEAVPQQYWKVPGIKFGVYISARLAEQLGICDT